LIKVAVHIVTYNNESTIESCLRSVLDQGVDVELCIIDNASTDNTVEIIKNAGLDVIVNSENRGYSAAHNQAIVQTTAPYILTLNPDVLLTGDFIAAMAQTLDKNQRIGSASGCLLRVDSLGDNPSVIDSAGLLIRRNRRQGLRAENMPANNRHQLPSSIFGPDGAAAFYRRVMLQDIAVMGEVFDQDFFMHKEDIDICWRALLRGWQSTYVPDAIAHHIRTFRPGQRASVGSSLRFYGVRNRYLLMMKNEVPALFWRDLWAIAIYDIGLLIYMVLFERASLRALSSGWSLRKKMLSKRRIIQTRRKISTSDMRPWLCGD
jgi:GT2 family glycosyltransferase